MKRYLVVGLVLLSGAAHAADRLPKDMLGAWATNPEACANIHSEVRMTVEPKIILYYEVAQTVRKVTKTKDGFWRVQGQSVDSDGKAPSTIELKLDGDKLVIGKADGQVYHRCPKVTAP
jgi:hypothetical protein